MFILSDFFDQIVHMEFIVHGLHEIGIVFLRAKLFDSEIISFLEFLIEVLLE